MSDNERPDEPVVLEARNLVKSYRVSSGNGVFRRRHSTFRAVDDVSLTLRRGRVTALVGQSGSGKSTVARLLAQLIPATSGEILLDGSPARANGSRQFRDYCGSVQMILQDPFGSLNPLHRVESIIGSAVHIHHPELDREGRRGRVLELLRQVNLNPADQYAPRFPHELSGGERQRVSIARALAADPRVLLADEPVSMLDVTIRRDTLDMIDRLRREANLAVLYITHDLASAQSYADQTLVMHHGVVVEQGDSQQLALHPQHEYTQRLLEAAPDPGRRQR